MTGDDRVHQIALVSQCNAENSHKNTTLIRPRNFCIPFSFQGDRKAIMVWKNSKIIQLSAIFHCPGNLGVVTAVAGCMHSPFSLVNSNHRSRANNRLSVSVCVAVSTPQAQRMGRSPIAECFSNFLGPELLFGHREGWMGWRNYVVSWIRCFYGYSLHCIVTRERFVGLGRLQSPAFLRFEWRKHVRNHTANNTEPKTRLKRPQIAPKLQKRHKDNPMLR